jgi:hypothetical protein
MKRFITLAAAAAVLAIPATASAAYSDQPGYDKANANTVCAGHGTFGYLGDQGNDRHDLGQGDTTQAGMAKLGADGPATGLANNTLCGNR